MKKLSFLFIAFALVAFSLTSCKTSTEPAEAEEAVRDMLAGNAFGEAGHRVVVEEFLQGEEASFIVMADGEHILALATSQDHKARDEDDHRASWLTPAGRSVPADSPAGLYAVHPVLVERRVAFAGEDVLAVVLLDRPLQQLFGLVSGGRHQRVVVIERNHR